MSDPDGVWRFHVMPCAGGWKVVEAGKTKSVHLKKGSAMSAAKRAYKTHTSKGKRAGLVNYVKGGEIKEELYGGDRKVRQPASWYASGQSEAWRPLD